MLKELYIGHGKKGGAYAGRAYEGGAYAGTALEGGISMLHSISVLVGVQYERLGSNHNASYLLRNIIQMELRNPCGCEFEVRDLSHHEDAE